MRSIEINGVSLKVVSGKTPHTVAKGRPKGLVRLACEALEPGESVLLPIKPEKVGTRLAGVGERLGAKFAYRTEGRGVRLYRVDAGKAKSSARGWNIRRAA